MEQAIRNLIKSNGLLFICLMKKASLIIIESWKVSSRLFILITSFLIPTRPNYTPFVCQLVRSLGGYAEVVSDMEYTLAKKLGYDNKQIVYNGPSKGEEMFDHLEHQGILNIDSLDEAKRIISYVKGHPDRNYTVGIRINMHVGLSLIHI